MMLMITANIYGSVSAQKSPDTPGSPEGMKLKDTCSLEESYDQPRQHIKKKRHYFANKGPSS